MDTPAQKADRIAAIREALLELVCECRLCGNRCGIDRANGARGLCRAQHRALEEVRVSSGTLHFGEEPVLVGTGGSGAVFFAHCNLYCVFCQNYQISQLGMGRDGHYRELARRFLDLAAQGAENINLVTPTHDIYPILLALEEARRQGLSIPLVYNTNGYDSIELLRLLDGIVDVYLPDLKYMEPEKAQRYSNARDYPAVAQTGLAEMFRQVGPIRVDCHGVATRGLLIRHLILPENISNTYDFLIWLKDAGLEQAGLSLMSQYSPQYRAAQYPELNKTISPHDYHDIVEYAVDLGIDHLLVQGLESRDLYLPDFERDTPFDQ